MSNAPQQLDMTDYVSSKSDHLTVEDFIAGPRVLTITEAGPTKDQDRPVYILFDGEPRAFLPSKTCRRILTRIWPDASKRAGQEYPGRRLRLFVDPEVTFGSDKVGGIRIDGASHIDRSVSGKLVSGRNKRSPFNVEPLPEELKRQPTTKPPPLPERIATAEAALTEIAPLRLEALQEKSGDLSPADYFKALVSLYEDVTKDGGE